MIEIHCMKKINQKKRYEQLVAGWGRMGGLDIRSSSSVGKVDHNGEERSSKTRYFPYIIVQIIIQEILALQL